MDRVMGIAAAALISGWLAGPAGAAGADDRAAPLTMAQAGGGICGWYVILGCSRRAEGAWATLDSLGGPGVGGWVGATVVNTDDYPNFRDGWYCVADGPYPTRDDAASIAWVEAVPDAYVKNGC